MWANISLYIKTIICNKQIISHMNYIHWTRVWFLLILTSQTLKTIRKWSWVLVHVDMFIQTLAFGLRKKNLKGNWRSIPVKIENQLDEELFPNKKGSQNLIKNQHHLCPRLLVEISILRYLYEGICWNIYIYIFHFSSCSSRKYRSKIFSWIITKKLNNNIKIT